MRTYCLSTVHRIIERLSSLCALRAWLGSRNGRDSIGTLAGNVKMNMSNVIAGNGRGIP